MNRYEVTIKFKNGKDLEFKTDTEGDLKQTFASSKKGKLVRFRDYFIRFDEILWLKIRGEALEGPSGGKREDTGTKIKQVRASRSRRPRK